MDTMVQERAHTGMMSEMNEKGDTKVIWDASNDEEVANAKATFDRLTKNRKFAAFNVGRTGKKGVPMKEFDPDAEKIILVPQLAGG